MKHSFRVGHDGAVNNAVIDYRVELLPIFIKFDSHDQLIIPIDELSEVTVSAWIDERLLRFTKIYFDVFFHHEYQKKCLETDPVLNITFPRTMAVSTKEYQGQRYHFYTDESFQLFEKDPAAYIEPIQER